MGRYSKEDIYRMVEEEDVKFIRLQFCDMFGIPKNLAITVTQLEKALDNRCVFCPSQIEGYQDVPDEMYLYPDRDTFTIYPWRPQTGKVARMYCDLRDEEGNPFEGDSRQVLKRVLDEAKAMGLVFEIRPELEFFLFHIDDDGHPTTQTHEVAGYYDVAPLDLAENVRRDIILSLEEMGFEITGSHHEISPAQHQIDFAEDRADRVADAVITFKMAAKTIAKKYGLYATFMPKPKEGVNGSGMHVNIFCRDLLGKNLFWDMDGEGMVSELGRQFMAGLLAHSKAITLITNPLVNSYKRLITGFNAPTSVSWSGRISDRSAVVNVPHRKGDATRIEYRSPDGVCNPYLAFAVILEAGMDGIRKQMVLPEENMGDADTLPANMGEAWECCSSDPMIRRVLGDYIYEELMKQKEAEWKEFNAVVTNWELKKYLGKY
ncbi:MAG: glutamine synthetase family protein [Eubacteriales bacterium]|nr:glutamine synthetase family protein [Eubacteriales bacterium]